MEETTSVEITNSDILDALNLLNQNTQQTNDSIKELSDYLVTIEKNREQGEVTREVQEQQNRETEKALEEQNEKEKASAEAEASAKADAQAETYENVLTEINNGIQFTNQLLVVQSIYIGIVVGLLFIKIMVDRITKK